MIPFNLNTKLHIKIKLRYQIIYNLLNNFSISVQWLNDYEMAARFHIKVMILSLREWVIISSLIITYILCTNQIKFEVLGITSMIEIKTKVKFLFFFLVIYINHKLIFFEKSLWSVIYKRWIPQRVSIDSALLNLLHQILKLSIESRNKIKDNIDPLRSLLTLDGQHFENFFRRSQASLNKTVSSF